MPRDGGASSNHCTIGVYWIARRSLAPRRRGRAMTSHVGCANLSPLIPAKVGIQGLLQILCVLGPRFRGDER